MLVGMANREDPDQTAPEEAVIRRRNYREIGIKIHNPQK